jgi:hypothetical protein
VVLNTRENLSATNRHGFGQLHLRVETLSMHASEIKEEDLCISCHSINRADIARSLRGYIPGFLLNRLEEDIGGQNMSRHLKRVSGSRIFGMPA